MRFGPVPIREAAGAILAHSVQVGGRRLRKGLVLTGADIASLVAAGVHEVTVARLEDGDLHEDAAAARLAEVLVAGPGLRPTLAAKGRVNLLTEGPGLVRIDPGRIDRANAVDPMITVATVPPLRRLGPGGMAATVKIISFGVAASALDRAAAEGAGAIGFAAPGLGTAALVETDVPGGPTGKGRGAIVARLERLGSELVSHVTVPHRPPEIAAALSAAEAELLLVLTGTATSDPRDVAPEGLRAAGGVVDHVGMPVDPGNLLFVGRLGARPVIGLPGCARAPALNGADWVMERVICGVPVGAADVMAMGVGGLLKERHARRSPP